MTTAIKISRNEDWVLMTLHGVNISHVFVENDKGELGWESLDNVHPDDFYKVENMQRGPFATSD